MSNNIEAVSSVGRKFSGAVEGYGSKAINNFKKLLFGNDGKVIPGNVPSVNHGSAFGYGFAADGSRPLAASDI